MLTEKFGLPKGFMNNRLKNTSFQSDLANVMFDTAPDPEREPHELAAVNRIFSLFETATSQQIFKHAPMVDRDLIPCLSGRNLLAVAKLIEARSPAAIDNMPHLSKRQKELLVVSELAQIFAPAALAQMAEVLGHEPNKQF